MLHLLSQISNFGFILLARISPILINSWKHKFTNISLEHFTTFSVFCSFFAHVSVLFFAFYLTFWCDPLKLGNVYLITCDCRPLFHLIHCWFSNFLLYYCHQYIVDLYIMPREK